jgi:hypothetical protein
MDFIEQVFRVAPDGGNGLTELAIVLVCVFVPMGVYWLRKTRVRVRESSGESANKH